MENQLEIKSKKIVCLLIEVIALLEKGLEKNPFLELEKSLKIVRQRNYNQYPSVKNKVRDVLMVIYGGKFDYVNEVVKKLDEVYTLISESHN